MKKITVFLSFIFLFVLAAPILAQTVMPKGGANFNSAIPITPGEYLSDRELPIDEYEFYTIAVNKGQVVRVKITTGADGYGDAAIYSGQKEKLASEVMIDANDSVTLNGQATANGIMYISVGGKYGTYAGNTYKISLETNMPTPTPEEGITTTSNQETNLTPALTNSNNNLTSSKLPTWALPAAVIVILIIVGGVLITKKKK